MLTLIYFYAHYRPGGNLDTLSNKRSTKSLYTQLKFVAKGLFDEYLLHTLHVVKYSLAYMHAMPACIAIIGKAIVRSEILSASIHV